MQAGGKCVACVGGGLVRAFLSIFRPARLVISHGLRGDGQQCRMNGGVPVVVLPDTGSCNCNF